MLQTAQIMARYGNPGESNLVMIDLPYPMRISWDKAHTIKRMQCHRLVADKFKAVFSELLDIYGLEKLQQLGIDLYGGCYNFRKMRGGTEWSRHSWGIAIDLDPERNSLKTAFKNSQFSKPQYRLLIDTFYKHGFVNLGKEKNYDSMHFEVAL